MTQRNVCLSVSGSLLTWLMNQETVERVECEVTLSRGKDTGGNTPINRMQI